MMNCAPAPLVRSLKDRFDSCDAVPRPWSKVFTTLAGCMHVWKWAVDVSMEGGEGVSWC